MDPITHGLMGAALSHLTVKRKASFWVLVIASFAPDIDYISRLWGVDVFIEYHRGITHGILALFLVPLIIGTIFGFKKGFFYFSFLAFIAYALHIFMDLLTQYGTSILAPLDWERYALDTLFILDPYITIGLILIFILGIGFKKKKRIIALTLGFVLIAYTGGRYHLRNVTEDFVRDTIDAHIFRICPLPNDFLRWWFVTQSGNELQVGFADLFTHRVYVQDTYTINRDDPYVAASEKNEIVKKFLNFAQFPYAEVQRNSDNVTVIWRELSYAFLRGDHFVAKTVFSPDGKIVKAFIKI